jgi:hypothetical protein
MGGQALAGDLLAAPIDPTVAAGDRLEVEFAAGSHVLDVNWAVAGARIQGLGREFAITLSALSYGSQQRTALDDRLGLFGGSFAPSDIALSGATVLLKDGATLIGAGATVTLAQLDDASAVMLSTALSARRRFSRVEIRAGISNLGTALSPFGDGDGTSLPVRLRAGAAFRPASDDLEFSGEALYRFGDEVFVWGMGGEWRPVPGAALRLGIIRDEAIDPISEGGLSDLGLTLGLAHRFTDWQLAYAYRPGGILGDAHLLSLGWSGGE